MNCEGCGSQLPTGIELEVQVVVRTCQSTGQRFGITYRVCRACFCDETFHARMIPDAARRLECAAAETHTAVGR